MGGVDDDDAMRQAQHSKFELRPQDVTILEPGDDFDENENENENDDEPKRALTMEGTEP